MSIDVAHVNELIRFFGEHEKAALRAEKRGAMRSELFDLPRRSVLGSQIEVPSTRPASCGRSMRC